MGKKWNKNIIRVGIVFTISICVCITYFEVIKQWKGIAGFIGSCLSAMTPIFIGIIIAFLLNPLMLYIRKGLTYLLCRFVIKKKPRNVIYHKTKIPGMILTLLLFIGMITLFVWTVFPSVYESLRTLVDNMPAYIDGAQKWIEKMFAKNEMLEGKLSEILKYVEKNILNIVADKVLPNIDTIVVQITSGVVIGVKAVLNFFLGLIVTVYLLASKEVLLAQGKKIIYCVFSKKTGNKIMRGLSYANSVFGGFINGKILDSIIIGFICFAFTRTIGMQYAVLISVIVGITNIIPFFGPFIGAVPGSLLALMDDPIMFIIFIVFILVLQQFDGNILGPLILGDSTGLSGIWVLFAILVGGDLFGIAGLVLGVPMFACIYAFIAVQLRDGLRAKNLSSKTEDYFRLIGFDEETGEPVYRAREEGRKPIKRRKSYLQTIVAKIIVKKRQEFPDEETLDKDTLAEIHMTDKDIYEEVSDENDKVNKENNDKNESNNNKDNNNKKK